MLTPDDPMKTHPRPEPARRRALGGGVIAAAAALTLLLPALPAAAIAPMADPASLPATEPMTPQRIEAANDAYNDAEATLEFITMSDTELGGSATADKTSEQVAYEGAKPHFQALRSWAEAKGFEPRVVVDNGDVVGANDPEYSAHLAGDSEKVAGWYRAVERVMRETFPESQVLLTQGNHDIADLMGTTFEAARSNAPAGAPEWFYPNADTGYVSNFHTTIEGIDFIGLDYNGTNTFGYSGQRSGYQAYLRSTLQEIAAKPDYDPASPIFVSIHSGYAGTSLGGPFHADYDMAGPDLQRILADYPQVMLGSAHTHFSSNPETSIFQKDFTVYENASMNYIYQDVPADFIGGGYFGGNQGDAAAGVPQKSANFVSVLTDGRTVIRRFDVTHQRWIGMPWVIDTTEGKSGFTYTADQRSTVAPWWGAAAVTASDIAEQSLTLRFDQAKDDELVNHYEVEIRDQAGNPVPFTANQVPDFGSNAPKSVAGSFKAYSRFYMTPNTMGFDIRGLKAAKNYTVTVTAYDDFQNASEPLTGIVRTAGELVFPDFPAAPAPAPDGEFLHLAFEGDLGDTGAHAGTAPAAKPVGSVSYVDTDRPGASGTAVRIGGGASNYIDLGSRPEFDLGTDKDLTIGFWTKVTGVSGYGAIISNKNWANWYRSGINLAPEGTNTGKLEFTLGDGANGVYATGDVGDYRGSWHHMTVTVDRTRNVASTYLDGVLAKEMSIAGIGSMTSGLNMLVGVDGSKSYGIGLDMDDLRMWDTALTGTEVAALFAAGDSTAENAALSQAVEYATELMNANEVEAANGRVFDQTLGEALATATSNSAALLAGEAAPLDRRAAAAPTSEQLRTSFDALKAAVDAVEAQTVRFSYRTEVRGGAVSPAEGVADRGGQVRLTLTPAAGFRIAGSTVTASGVDSFAIEGSDLVLTGVQSRVLASVEFAAVDAGTPGEDGDGGTGNGSPGDGHGTDTNPGADSSPDPLATTGADGTIGWVWTGLALTLLAAGAWLFHLRRRSV
ncbi:LamG domain-containing protein [Microbacterium sp. Root1433D1]|uniref:LamG domain-containing protein n=1 Tax=Microbacterium sp. Root1433D1 TaxID=1736463 RepID=UPI000A7B7433|nr:LamG domain-containing protein [Microbacterium sp. Root1433D1]